MLCTAYDAARLDGRPDAECRSAAAATVARRCRNCTGLSAKGHTLDEVKLLWTYPRFDLDLPPVRLGPTPGSLWTLNDLGVFS
jgi:hypothetical protein